MEKINLNKFPIINFATLNPRHDNKKFNQIEKIQFNRTHLL